MADVDCWDKARDARLYAGPFPVVTHPPCERWGRYWSGGPSASVRRTLGDDGGCFLSALNSVRLWGGVLEHPEASHAFMTHGLNRPGWRKGWEPAGDGIGHVCCVAQRHYGHRARKLTWLYAAKVRLPELDWSIPAPGVRLDMGFHTAAERLAKGGQRGPRLTPRENTVTPVEFARLLVSIAQNE